MGPKWVDRWVVRECYPSAIFLAGDDACTPTNWAPYSKNQARYSDLVDDAAARAAEQVGQALTKAMEKEVEGA